MAEANNRSAIVLSFSHRVCFLINIFEKLPFSHKSDHRLHLGMSRILFAAKHS